MPWEAPPQTYLSGNTAGTTHVFGPVVTLQGGANVTLSGAGNKIIFSAPAAGTITVAGSAAISAGTQSVSTGTVKFADSNGVTFGMSGSSQITATVKTDYLTAQSAFVLSASNGLAWGTNGSTVTGSYTVPTVPAQTAYVFSDSNGISWGTNGSTVTGTVKTDYLTTARASTDAIGLNTAKTQVTWTVNSSGLSIDAGAYLTTARASTDAIGLNTAKTAVTWTVNSSGLSIDAGAYLTTARASNDAVGLNTAKTNVTWTVNSSGISLNAGGYAGTGAAATSASVTLDTSGLSINVGPYITTARASTDAIGLNTAQTNVTWTVNSSGLSLNAGGYAGTVSGATGCSVTANTAGVSVNVPNYATTISYWENPRIDGLTSWSGTSNSISVQRVFFPAAINATRADFILNISGSSSGSLSLRANLAIYTQNHSTLSTVSSTSRGFTFQSTSAQSYTAWSGPRSVSIGLGTWNFTSGEYYLAMNFGWTTGGSNTNFIAMYGNSAQAISGAESGALANLTDFFRTGMINNNAQSTLPATMQLSGMTQTGVSAGQQPWIGFHGTY